MAKKGFTRRAALVAATSAAAATAACSSQGVDTPPYSGNVAFNHGVASGDPQSDKVVIWTRVTPEQAGPVPVRWILARDRELTDVVKSGVVQATEARDYTVKADVTGLRSGAPYFYGFRAGQARSTIGKTKTLPTGQLSELKLAVVTCASFPHGFFNAYEAAAQRNDVDVVVHLGDYIYEYGLSGYGGETGIALGRIPAPQVDCVHLADYRLRHAQCKGEAELQALHAKAPWITVWDDHEVANDDWSGGAENHHANEGAFADRKRAAVQAYYEWMPIREPQAGRAFEAINRSFQFGDLFTLIMLETRLLARSKQIDYATDMPIATQRWDFSDPRSPVALRAGEPDGDHMRQLPAIFEDIAGTMQPVLDWRRAGPMLQNAQNLPRNFYLSPDNAELNRRLSAPERALMGTAQEQWFSGQLADSKRAGSVWQVIGNQTMMAPVTVPDLSRTPPQLVAALEHARAGTTQLLKLTRFPFPLNTDAWDGYPAVRTRVLDTFRRAGGNPIVITGDSHAAWANEIDDAQGRVAVEFGTTSITSPGFGDYFVRGGMDFGALLRARNPQVKWTNQLCHGFILLTLTHQQAKAEFFKVSTIETKQYQTTLDASFTVTPSSGQGIGAITPTRT